MSRGRGGGRGGRGGGRGGRPQLPWDTGDEIDGKPSELFPAYMLPIQRDLTPSEHSSINHFLLLRHQIHASPLYTSRKDADEPDRRKTYGQAQANAVYGVRSKAAVDLFTAMPMYSHRFVRSGRGLPDWSNRAVCAELFPEELRPTVAEGTKRRRLEMSRVTALPDAEEAFGLALEEGEGEGRQSALERLAGLGEEDEEVVEEGEEEPEEDVDEEFDDEDAGDYDAENYFDDGGDDIGEDMGDGDDGEGTF